MVRKTPLLDKFYRELSEKENLSHAEALRIYEALYQEAVAQGVISHETIWDGFEVDLLTARAMQGLEHIRETRETTCQNLNDQNALIQDVRPERATQ